MTHFKTTVVVYWMEAGDRDEFTVCVEGPDAGDWDDYSTDDEQEARDEADSIAEELGCDVVWAS